MREEKQTPSEKMKIQFLYKGGALPLGSTSCLSSFQLSQDSEWGTRGNHEGTSDFTNKMAIVVTNQLPKVWTPFKS